MDKHEVVHIPRIDFYAQFFFDKAVNLVEIKHSENLTGLVALENIYKLYKALTDGTYKFSKYNHFTVYEPKKREIQTLRYCDRVVQHSVSECAYLFNVIAGFVCPKITESVFTSIPHSKARVANVWRKV